MHAPRTTRPFAAAWLAGEAAATSLLGDGHRDREARVRAVHAAASRRCDARLVAELERQHAALASNAARVSNLRALAEGGAAVVAAGQQVGLFTGPAFALYKAAGLVVAARRLAEESGRRVVPVFWLPTEDHDHEEIDHCHVVDAGGVLYRLALAHGSAAPRVSVATLTLDEHVHEVFSAFREALSARPHAGEVEAVLARHYAAGVTLHAAFRGLLDELFAADGLLFLDPRTPVVAELAAPLFESSLLRATAISARLREKAGAIEAAGFGVQVALLDGAPLCFFHPDGAHGPRYRLEPDADGWRLRGDGRRFDRRDVLRALASEPLRLSTSALLRPAVEDFLLPTAMVLGGPAEIAYFAEAAPVYEELGVSMPLVSPRPSFVVTAAADRRRLEALGLRPNDLAAGREELLGRLARRGETAFVDPDTLEARLLAGFHEELGRFEAAALGIDEALARPVAKARDSVGHAVSLLAARYRRALLLRDEVAVERLDRVLASLRPGGSPQERVVGFASLAAEHGVARLRDAVIEAVTPFDGTTREIAL